MAARDYEQLLEKVVKYSLAAFLATAALLLFLRVLIVFL